MLLIAKAYDVDLYQLSGPDWVFGDLFEITARVPEGATVEQLRGMLKSLLAERFELKIREETRETSGYELIVATGGPKLKEAGAPAQEPGDFEPTFEADRDGFPLLQPGQTIAVWQGRARRHTQETINELARFLTLWLGKPVIDGTSLTARYDITLSFVQPRPLQAQAGAPELSGPTLVDAVRAIGLKLESKKVQVQYRVIESARRVPTAN